MLIADYKNGNARVKISETGTREITFEGDLELDYPLNIDIRVSSQCAFGLNPKTGKAFCSFCHEEARTDGSECDYNALMNQLEGLPPGIELAIGGNSLTDNLVKFLAWANRRGYICNLTINQGHVQRDYAKLMDCISEGYIKGLGISYREGLAFNVPQDLLDYENTVFHVIAGIDSFVSVEALAKQGVKKILILGEKDFGFNKGNVDLSTQKHKEWLWWTRKLFDDFSAVSFDNLALEQLRVKRFFNTEAWSVFNQGEHSFYINAVEKYFAPSSRSPKKTKWIDSNVLSYFKELL